MNTGLILSHRYPKAEPSSVEGEGDYFLKQDVNGKQVITYWNTQVLGPQPDEATLRGWWLTAEKWQAKRMLGYSADRDYGSLLAPDGVNPQLERDELLEIKGANRAGTGIVLNDTEKALSAKIDALRVKWKDRKRDIETIQQSPGETLESAVGRVRAVGW